MAVEIRRVADYGVDEIDLFFRLMQNWCPGEYNDIMRASTLDMATTKVRQAWDSQAKSKLFFGKLVPIAGGVSIKFLRSASYQPIAMFRSRRSEFGFAIHVPCESLEFRVNVPRYSVRYRVSAYHQADMIAAAYSRDRDSGSIEGFISLFQRVLPSAKLLYRAHWNRFRKRHAWLVYHAQLPSDLADIVLDFVGRPTVIRRLEKAGSGPMGHR